jgi:hypothetical protein
LVRTLFAARVCRHREIVYIPAVKKPLSEAVRWTKADNPVSLERAPMTSCSHDQLAILDCHICLVLVGIYLFARNILFFYMMNSWSTGIAGEVNKFRKVPGNGSNSPVSNFQIFFQSCLIVEKVLPLLIVKCQNGIGFSLFLQEILAILAILALFSLFSMCSMCSMCSILSKQVFSPSFAPQTVHMVVTI